MFPENLTRAEAQARSALLATSAYRVRIRLSGTDVDPETHFVSTSEVRFSARDAGTTHIDLIADRVLGATLDDEALDLAGFNGARLGFDVTPGEHVLSIEAVHRFSRSGEGLHRFIDPADDRTYLYTQFEPADARRVYACFEQPDLKATFDISVVAPATWTVTSCGHEIGREAAGEGLAEWTFATTREISTYLTALVAGEYHRVERVLSGGETGEVPAALLCRQSLAEHLDADRIYETTAHGFGVFEEHFGYPYPFSKYDQCFVPEYNSGAMENVGCVVLRDDYLFRGRVTAANYQSRDDTVLHELSHMWFGDLVTMKWWDDLWLKESFATWASNFASAQRRGPEAAWAAFSNSWKPWAARQDQLPSTHPIAADMVDLQAVELNFDGITYAKGASVLVQLVAFVGQEAFLAGLRAYFQRHAYGNTQLTDLLAVLEESSGRDLSGWSAQWLETAGVNTLRPELSCGDGGLITEFAVTQQAAEAYPTLRDHRLAIGLYDLVGSSGGVGGLTRTDRIELDVAGPRTVVPELVGRARPDLVLVNDDDLTFAKVRLDPDSLRTLVGHIHTLGSPLTRAVCWGATWDMCRDAELAARDYVDLGLRGIAVETDLTAMVSVLSSGLKAAADYTAPAERAAVLARWHAGLGDLLAAAEPESDQQLAIARGYVWSAETGSADRLAGWLVGDAAPPGLEIDQDLRWIVVGQLARLGRFEAAEIAAEHQRDKTITGSELGAGALAARPTAAAKAEAWAAAVERTDVPNNTHRSICRMFWQRGQDEVLDGYAERYLEAVAAISANADGWAEKGSSLRTDVLRDLFPQPTDLAGFVQRLDAWLDGRDLADFVRRIVSERRDDTLRALRCQAAAER